MDAPVVQTISLAQRLMWLVDGRCLPITNLLDHMNEETDDEAEAVIIVGGSPAVGWFTLAVADFIKPTFH